MRGRTALHITKRLLFFLGVLCLPFSGFGQEFPFQVWHKGKVVLMNGDTLKGLVKYNIEGDIVQLDTKRQVRAFSAQKVLYFEIFDKIFESFRYFYSLPFQVQPNYKTPILFEVLYEGPLTLLAREYVVEETIQRYGYYYRNPYMTRTRLAFDYYFLDQEGEIQKYSSKKKDLFEIMKKKENEVRKYMKKNKLKYDRRKDLVQLVAYYNSLLEE